MQCFEFESHLSDALEGVLDPARARAFHEHRSGCRSCNLLWLRVGTLVTRLHALPEIDPPAHLVEAVLARTRGPRRTWSWGSFLAGTFRPLLTQRTAAAAALSVLFALVGSGALTPESGPWSLASLTPSAALRRADAGTLRTYRQALELDQSLRVAGAQVSSQVGEWWSFVESEWIGSIVDVEVPATDPQPVPREREQQNRGLEPGRKPGEGGGHSGLARHQIVGNAGTPPARHSAQRTRQDLPHRWNS